MTDVILSNHYMELIRDLFKIDADFRSDEELFLKVKEDIISFYRDKFGLDVKDSFNNISFSTITTSGYWDAVYEAVAELIYDCHFEGKECADIEKLKEIFLIMKDKVDDNKRTTFITHAGSNYKYIPSELKELKSKFRTVFGNNDIIYDFLTDYYVGAFYTGCNLSGGTTKFVFVKKCTCRSSNIELIITHELNHAIESKVLYEDDNFLVSVTGWKVNVENKKRINGKSKSESMFFSKEDRELLANYFELDFNQLRSCTTPLEIEAMLFLLKNGDKVLPDEYFKLFKCTSVVLLNEAINDYISYKIFENANGRVKFKTNYDYYKFFPLIRKFYETFEDDIILSRHDSNISILDKVGIDNFINLANLLYKYVNMYGSGYMSVDELIRESDSIVQKMVDYSKKILGRNRFLR